MKYFAEERGMNLLQPYEGRYDTLPRATASISKVPLMLHSLPLHRAMRAGNSELVRYLLQATAHPAAVFGGSRDGKRMQCCDRSIL